jgi:hypothetical protein
MEWKFMTVSLPKFVKRAFSRTSESDEEVVTDFSKFAHLFADITPWSGQPPKGFFVDFLGVLTAAEFRVPSGTDPAAADGKWVQTRLPTMEDGEGWFEAANWVMSAREASDNYVMITLGACYGVQAVGAALALQKLNPMPFKLVAVEPDPENMLWVRRHMSDNGIDPDRQWLIRSALGADDAPIFFPVGSPGSGAQNCFSTNEASARKDYVDNFIQSGKTEEALRNLLLHNTTGLHKTLIPGTSFDSEIRLLSAITLKTVLGPFDRVDYLESDIQQSEIIVFPPAREELKRKVRRIHLGTHGKDVHWELHRMFEQDGWQIVFSYEPNAKYRTTLGTFETNDGVLTVVNPDLA